MPVNDPRNANTDVGVSRTPSVGQKTCIIVAGMHRSGTSAVARVVNLLGADIARDLMPPKADNNDRGFWESNAVFQIHERLLYALGSAHDDVAPLPDRWIETSAANQAKRDIAKEIDNDFAESNVFVVKDPRISRLLPLWLSLLDDLEIRVIVVIPVRNPLEIANSLLRRDQLPLTQSFLLYIRHALEAELASRGRERLFIAYDRLLGDWSGFATSLAEAADLRLPPDPNFKTEIADFLTSDLYRHRASREQLVAVPNIATTVVEVYDRMLELAAGGSDTTARKAFDRLRLKIEEATRLFQGILSAQKSQLTETIRQAQEQKSQLEGALNDQSNKHSIERNELTAKLDSLSSERNELTSKLNDLSVELVERNQSITLQSEELAQSRQALEQRSAELARARETLKQAQHRSTEIERLYDQRSRDVTRLEGETAALRVQATEFAQALEELQRELDASRHQVNSVEVALSGASGRAQQLAAELEAERHRGRELTRMLDFRSLQFRSLQASTSWRLTAPLRAVGDSFPRFANVLRRGASSAVRLLTTRPDRLLQARHQWRRQLRLVSQSVLFDRNWYLNRYPDVRASGVDPARHYLVHGASEDRDPSALFDSSWYLAQYPDVRAAGINPLVHYLIHGTAEGRDPRALSPATTPEISRPPQFLQPSDWQSDSDRIRLIAFTHNLNHEGAPNSQFEIVAGLHHRAIIEAIVLSPAEGPLRSAYHAAGIPVQIITPPNLSDGVNEFESSVAAIAQAVRLSGAQLVYANTLQTFWAIAIAEQAGLPAVWNVRESEPWQTYFDFLKPELRPRAYQAFTYPTHIVFVANSTRKAWEPLDRRGTFLTIPNGLNLSRIREQTMTRDRTTARARLQLADNEIAVVLVGTVCERKGQLDLMRSLQSLSGDVISRLRVFFVGDRASDYSTQLHAELASMAPTTARVTIVPETDEPYLYYQAADVAVCCSRIESYPRVILEAMAHELPIVTTPVFGIAEQVKEGVNALFYQPGDVALLAAHLSRLARNPELRREFGRSSARVLASLPDFNAMLDGYDRVFREAQGANQVATFQHAN